MVAGRKGSLEVVRRVCAVTAEAILVGEPARRSALIRGMFEDVSLREGSPSKLLYLSCGAV